MALMHPMYNHVGRSKKRKRKKTASMIVAEKQHNAWLKSMGLDKKPKRVNRTMISVNYHTESPVEERKRNHNHYLLQKSHTRSGWYLWV